MKHIILSILFVFTGLVAQAQIDGKNIDREEFEAYKVAFFTRKLSLTKEEAKGFWPVFESYQQGERAIKKQFRSRINFATEDDKVADEMIETALQREEALVAHKRSYVDEFKEVLPSRKVLRFFKAEREFVNAVLRRLSNKKRGGK